MDKFQKLALVASATEFETDGEPSAISSPRDPPLTNTGCQWSLSHHQPPAPLDRKYILAKGHQIPIHMAVAPRGKRIPLLKAMLTTACEMDCHYCAFTKERNFRRVNFKPHELAEVFVSIHRKGLVEGLFLSTGIFGGGANTQNRLIDTAEILRYRHGYRGYIHLKIMPGSEKGQLLQAMKLADRVSVNLEAPNPNRLALLAPGKQFQEQLLEPMKWMEEIRRTEPPQLAWDGRWPSSTTQFVVGPAGETDLELISVVAHLTKSAGCTRSYFEAFKPVPDTPLENHAPENPLRQHRLYQVSFLLRDYGFDPEDFSFTKKGNLPLEIDPKLAYAQTYLSHSPIELNTADASELLRVPGIGQAGAKAITMARQEGKLWDISQLKKMGILAERAAPYIILNGKQPTQQLKMF